MLTKILFTLLVIAAAAVYLRHQGQGQGQGQVRRPAEAAPASPPNRDAMVIAVALVLLSLAISAGLYYLHWRDSHRLFDVRVVNTHSGAEQHYRVYRDGLMGRTFETTGGRVITLSASERMEVVEMAEE